MTFEESMVKCNTGMDSSENWKVMKDHYEKFYMNYTGEKTQKIPKIIHQIWLGSPFPDKYKILTDRWKVMHPDWTFILWDEQKIEEFGLTNKWMYDESKNPGTKSDVARYEILHSYGGVYIDIDFVCSKNFDDILYLDMFCGIIGTYDGKPVDSDNCTANSIFGVSKGNKLLEKIILNVKEQRIIPTNISEIMRLTGSEMFSRTVIANFSQYPMTVIFPASYFYPFPGQWRESIRNMKFDDMQQFVLKYRCPETYAIHLWNCSWQKAHLL